LLKFSRLKIIFIENCFLLLKIIIINNLKFENDLFKLFTINNIKKNQPVTLLDVFQMIKVFARAQTLAMNYITIKIPV
jgi:hypothetical protein